MFSQARVGVSTAQSSVFVPLVRRAPRPRPARRSNRTVDEFQGQQAPVVSFSMATSSGEDVPRKLEFLLSRSRLNVAVSRVKCQAYVVASPKLFEVGCRSIEQMRMASACSLRSPRLKQPR